MATQTAPGRIVVGIDDSDASIDALRWATDEAARRGAQLDIVGVWDVEPVNVGIEMAVLVAPHGQPAERFARLEQAVDWIRPEREGVAYTTELLSGSSGVALTQRAVGAELLVLGRPSHGASRFGSPTLNHILKHIACPVVLVPSQVQVLTETAAHSA
jgi:nucleotide-binding universal stress UspA family protein